MHKVIRIQNLDCANCAAKMEMLIKKIPGVEDASMNFMMQKLTLTAPDDRFEEIVRETQKVCTKVDDGCLILR